jgi:hypothetical protein
MSSAATKEKGQCWSCGSKGVELILDPMGSGPQDTIHICRPCTRRRESVKQMYENSGRQLIISPPLDPMRDNTDYTGPYCTVRDSLLWEFLWKL